MRYWVSLFFIVVIAVLLAGCSTTKYVKDGEYLLKTNKIIIQDPHAEIDQSDLYDQIQQKPNKKFLGIFPFKLWYKSIFKKKGEDPVILDLIQIENSNEKLKRYLHSSGFFNAHIDHSIEYPHKKKAKVQYLVTLSQPYHVRNFNYRLDDSSVLKVLNKYRVIATIDEGDVYNEYALDDERDRITNVLNNNGYYRFSKEFVFFKVDSALNNHELDIEVVVQTPGGEEKIASLDIFKPFVLNDVIVYPNHDIYIGDSGNIDTTLVFPRLNTRKLNSAPHVFIYRDPLNIKPKAISRHLFIKQGDSYNAEHVRSTYSRLNQQGIFKKTNIQFSEVENKDPDSIGYLNCQIQLQKRPSNAYTLELNGTNKGGDLGVGGYLSYQNRNLFKGAELLSIRLKGAIEFQKGGFVEDDLGDELKYYNTYETGLDAKILFPVFLVPIKSESFERLINPKTTILAGYNYQDRRNYNRTISYLSYGYNWKTSLRHEHQFYPVDINLVKVNKTKYFDSILDGTSLRLQNLYTDHMIFSMRYSYTYNGQNIYKLKNFIYYRGNIEPSGNLLNALSSALVEESEQDYRTLFNIRYAQFIKTDHDVRYYIFFKPDHSIAFRTHFGIGFSYGNSVDLPLGKAFYGGGANGMRGWRLRYLGPGSYDNTAQEIESFGDLILEGNIEYRFPLYRYLNGALFYDIGNLWMIRENETYPGGTFAFNRFYKELAMDAGIGFRLDFSYFLIRIDVAQKLKDPSLQLGQRWIFSQEKWLDPVLNFGIGYPF